MNTNAVPAAVAVADVAPRAVMDKHGTEDASYPENVNHPLHCMLRALQNAIFFIHCFFRIDILEEHRQEHGPHNIFNVVHLTKI